MKKLVLLVLLCMAANALFAQYPGDKVLGMWITADKIVKIEIYRSGNKYFGKVLWGALLYEKDGKTSLKDIKNPDSKLKNRDCIGLVFITDLTYSDGEYTGGQIFDSSHGTTYNLKMKMLDDNDLEMRGYMGMSLFGRTLKWIRG
jgi:uncharacterized protein (DUF2147 family)